MADNPYATVRRYVNAFNDGDVDAMAAECADPMQILDGMAPHVWQGADAARDWWRDVQIESEHLGASGYRITLGAPRHLDIADDYGYVVVPASMTFDLGGMQRTQEESTFVAALRRVESAWLLTAWAWSKGG